MSETFDDGQKTEDPSQRRLQRAREEGRVVQSREINTWFVLGATGIVIVFVAPASAGRIGRALEAFVEPTRYLAADGSIIWPAVMGAMHAVVLAMALPIAVLMIAGVAGSVLQTGLVLATERIGFDASHLSLTGGLGRILSLRSVVELGKSVAKIAAVSAVLVWLLRNEAENISNLAVLTPEDSLAEIRHLMLRLLVGVLAVLTPLGAADYV